MSETIVSFSVDTEGDQWVATRDDASVENVRELPRLQSHCDRLGVPVTYFTDYQVAATSWASGLLRDLQASGRAEIGAHLHPWNTPPLEEPFLPRYTMTNNLPLALQRAKLETLTNVLEASTGVRPRSFRGGRFGFSRATAQALIELGYRVDSSVTPWVSWEDTDHGPEFIGAPLPAYTLDGRTDVRDPVPGGPLVELSVSCGFTRWPFHVWHRVYEALADPWLRPLRLRGIAGRFGLVREVVLSPEVNKVSDMLRLARLLVGHGVSHLCFFIHSSSLVPGLSPFVRTEADLRRMYSGIAEFVNGLGRFTTPMFATASDAATMLGVRTHSADTDSVVEEERGCCVVYDCPATASPPAATTPLAVRSGEQPLVKCRGNWLWLAAPSRCQSALQVGGALPSLEAVLADHFKVVHHLRLGSLEVTREWPTERREGRDVTTAHGSIPAVPYDDASFDCVVLHLSGEERRTLLHGRAARRELFGACANMLRPGGVLYLESSNAIHFTVGLRRPGSLVDYSVAVSTDELRRAGFLRVCKYYVGPSLGWPFTMVPATREATRIKEILDGEPGARGFLRRLLATLGLHRLTHGACFLLAYR